jgi:hypothetical protein
VTQPPPTLSYPSPLSIEGWSALAHNRTLFWAGIGMFVSAAVLVPLWLLDPVQILGGKASLVFCVGGNIFPHVLVAQRSYFSLATGGLLGRSHHRNFFCH